MRVITQGVPPKRGGPRQVPRLPPLKHTTDNMPRLPICFSLNFVYGEIAKKKVTFVKFCVKSFSC